MPVYAITLCLEVYTANHHWNNIRCKKLCILFGFRCKQLSRKHAVLKRWVAVASYTVQLQMLLAKSAHCHYSCILLSLLLTSVSAGKETGGRPGPWQQEKLVTFPVIMWLQLIPSKQRSMFSFYCKDPLVLYLEEVWGVDFDRLRQFFKLLTLFLFQF